MTNELHCSEHLGNPVFGTMTSIFLSQKKFQRFSAKEDSKSHGNYNENKAKEFK